MTPRVTVVIAVWDSYCTLVQDAVASVLEQTGPAVEVIVVDNASQTPLPPLPAQVSVVRAPARLSAGAARNLAVPQVRTPYILFLDADDRLLRGAVYSLATMLDEHPAAVAAVGKHLLWDPVTGAERVVARAPRPLVYRIAPHPRLFALLTLRFDCYPLVGCGLLRTTAIRDAGGFGDADLAEDWMLRSALAWRGPVAFTRRPIARIRVGEGTLWHRSHSREDLDRMYRAFAERMNGDQALSPEARLLMPWIVRGHRREARRRTRDGSFRPARRVA
jgi:glycosyltransferase involved in cell wall biosynthesis